MGREFELKFGATPQIHAEIRQRFGSFDTISMETTYYDTPTGDLSARRITLRRRFEGGRAVCTLKTPAPGNARGEWEVEEDNIEAAIQKLCKLGGWEELPFLAARGLQALCGARFTRHYAAVCRDGTVLEIALDDGVLTGGGKEIPLCEVEVELKSGSEEVATAFARELAREFGLTEEPSSKFARASRLAKGE